MSFRSRRSASSVLSSKGQLGGGQAQVGTDNSFMQSMLKSSPAGPLVDAWNGLGALGDVLNSNEDLGNLQEAGSDLESAAGFAGAAGGVNMPGAGVVGSIYGLTNTARAVDDIQDNGWNPENCFALVNGVVGTVGPWLGPTGSALAAAWSAGTTAGKHLDKGSEMAAQHFAGEDGDARGLSDRLADRGLAVDSYLDNALADTIGADNADLAGDILGGAFTVGQVLTPALHYDLIDSYTGGGLTETKDAAGEKLSEAWDWATDW